MTVAFLTAITPGMYESIALLCPPNVPVALRQDNGQFGSQPQPQPQARGSAGYPRLIMRYSVPGLFPVVNEHKTALFAGPWPALKTPIFGRWRMTHDLPRHHMIAVAPLVSLFSSRQLRCLLLFHASPSRPFLLRGCQQ